jgi:hypothetical protein
MEAKRLGTLTKEKIAGTVDGSNSDINIMPKSSPLEPSLEVNEEDILESSDYSGQPIFSKRD